MCERRADEDENSFRQRLDSMTDSFREKRRAWADSSAQAGTAVRDKARMAADKTQDFYNSNPLVGGILVAAVGAAIGSSLPITRQEQEKLGNVGEKARDMASEQKDQISSKLHETKDQALEKADEKIQQGSPDQNQPAGSQQPSPELTRI